MSKNKGKLQKEASERHQNLSEEENTKSANKLQKDIKSYRTENVKEKRRQYYQERKQKLPEYRRNYYLAHKK